MTDRRHPAAVARVLLAAGSTATTLVLVAAMAAASPPEPAPAVTDTGLRVVITDARISPEAAVAAAQAGARSGRHVVKVPVAGAPAPSPPAPSPPTASAPAPSPPTSHRQVSGAPHTATRSS